MPLEPIMQVIADALAAIERPAGQSMAERRDAANKGLLQAASPRPEGVVVTEHTLPVEGGEITVRFLSNADLESPAPTYFFLHGGGWMQGNLDTGEVECGHLWASVPCLVASVEYRLAPEHPFPIPLEDCLTAYLWLLDNADELGVDRSRVAIGGCSAGGNLAAALCLTLRDRGLPMPVLQMLDAPSLDLTMSSPSFEDYGRGKRLSYEEVGEMGDFYAGDTPRTHPRVSPLFEPDLSGLPPTFITVAECDPVRDDGERYLTRLHEAGVPAAAIRVLAQFHGGWMIPITPTSRLIDDVRSAALRRAFAGTLVPQLVLPS